VITKWANGAPRAWWWPGFPPEHTPLLGSEPCAAAGEGAGGEKSFGLEGQASALDLALAECFAVHGLAARLLVRNVERAWPTRFPGSSKPKGPVGQLLGRSSW